MLKITKASDTINVAQITMCVYAVPGVGRTSTGFTADKPILFDFDKAAYRSKNRRDAVLMESWADVTAITDEDLAPYKTVVIDTVGRALDMLTVKIIKDNPKAGTKTGGLALQGYGELKNAFAAWLGRLRERGLDVVLLAHMDEKQQGDSMIERLDIQGSTKNEVYKVSDAMGRIYFEGGRRILNFSPTDVAFGKNPGQFPPLDIPDFAKDPDFLAGIIAKTKASLNAMTTAQVEIQNLVAAWALEVSGAETAAALTALVDSSNETDERIRPQAKAILMKAAKGRGFEFDKGVGAFVSPKEAPPSTAPASDAPSGSIATAPAPEPKKAKGKKAEPIEEPGAEG